MRLTILRMLSSTSLSAFTAAVQARAKVPVTSQAGPTVAMPVRARSDPAPQDSGRDTSALTLRPQSPPPQPDRSLPRGSLLDLSV